jgi:hypothetical protein
LTYFKFAGPFNSFKHEDAWKKTLHQIKNSPHHGNVHSLSNVTFPIEVKALHIFTLSSRFLRSVDDLVKLQGDKGWHPVFLETSVLLFPVLEIIGNAVKTEGSDKLVAGIYWLQNPRELPSKVVKACEARIDNTILDRVHKDMPAEQTKPTVRAVYQLRNYYLHGVVRSSDSTIPKEEEIISYSLPKGLAGAIEEGLYSYWECLTEDDGKRGWVNRLARADIHPLIIPGSFGFADDGLIDPDTIDRILNRRLRG